MGRKRRFTDHASERAMHQINGENTGKPTNFPAFNLTGLPPQQIKERKPEREKATSRTANPTAYTRLSIQKAAKRKKNNPFFHRNTTAGKRKRD